MSAVNRSYFPAPNWDIPPTSDLVVLGRLIKDPRDPESKILNSSDVPLAPPKVYEGEKVDWETTAEQLRSHRIGLWAKCLQFIQGELSFTQIKSVSEAHKFDFLTTTYFVPDDDYCAKALADEGVQAYLEVNNWRKPVYLITGIKVAKGAQVRTEHSVERSVQAELKVDGTSVEVPVEVGPEWSKDSQSGRGISFGGSTDYIFAYRLTKMKPKRGGNKSQNKAFVKGAVYGTDKAGATSLFHMFDIEEADSGFADAWEEVEADQT